MNFSFIHAADIHLGRPFSNIKEDAKLYKKATQNAFNNLIDYALVKNVDFVLIAGDTFDSDEQDFESKLILKEGLKKLEEAGIKVFLICGNHDALSSYSKTTFNFGENSIIKIVGLNSNFNDKFIINDDVGNQIAMVHALSFQESIFSENPVKYFSPKSDNLFNIGLLHCDLDGSKDSPYAPCTKSDLDSLGYDYWALGHIHIPNEYYSGTIQGRNTKETGAHGIRHIKVENGSIIKNTLVPIDVVRFVDIDIDLSHTEDITNAGLLIQEKLKDITDADCDLFLVRLNLIGFVNFYSELTKEFSELISEKIKSDTLGKVCISEISNNTTAIIDEEVLAEDDGISGALYKTINNEVNIINSIKSTENQLKHLLNFCNFSPEEYEIFKKEVEVKTKETCKNICTQVYGNNGKED